MRKVIGIIWILLVFSAVGVLAQEKAAPHKAIPPTFKEAWRIEVPAGARRIGVGDITGDKKARLVIADAEQRLIIYRLSKTGLEKETTLEPGAGADQFVIGHFLKGKPECIVMPKALYCREGAQYVRTPVAELKAVTGMARYADGRECVLDWDLSSAPQTWSFDLSLPGVLRQGPQMLPPNQAAGIVRLVVIRGTPEFLAQLDAPGEFGKAGVIGSFDPRGDDGVSLWAPQVTAEGSYFVVSNTEGQPIWRSGKLDRILDVAHGADLKGGKQTGVLLLLATGPEGKGRAVQFLALDEPARAR